jgi:hypothetical protein
MTGNFLIHCGTMRLLCNNEQDAEETAAALCTYVKLDSMVYHNGKLIHEFFAS